MSASRGRVRARVRAQLTGETYQQARELAASGTDGVPDAETSDQIALEGAILAELDACYTGDGHPLDGHVYGIRYVRPTHSSVLLDVAPGQWHTLMNHLLPGPEPDPDIEGLLVSGIPGLRARLSPHRRIELFRPGHSALVTLQLQHSDLSEASEWLAYVQRSGEVWTADDWSASERASLPAYEHWVGDAHSRSHVLRRILAFRHLPAIQLVSETGAVPTRHDIEQLIQERQRQSKQTQPPPAPVVAPYFGRATVEPPLVIAVASLHSGDGRTTLVAELGQAFAKHGRHVLLVDADPQRSLTNNHGEELRAAGVTMAECSADSDSLNGVRDLACAGGHDVVLLDTDPMAQPVIAEAADEWLGVISLRTPPDLMNGPVETECLGIDGQPLPSGWRRRWLHTMRTNRWHVTWRLTSKAPELLLDTLNVDRCAGLVLLGTREMPGARAVDVLRGTASALPTLPVSIPLDDGHPRTRHQLGQAYRRLAAELFEPVP